MGANTEWEQQLQPFRKLQNNNHTANFKGDWASKAIQQAHLITDSPLHFRSSGIASAVRDFCFDMSNEEVKENMLFFYEIMMLFLLPLGI